MTTLDRAFIKAFSGAPAARVSRSPPADSSPAVLSPAASESEPAWPSGRATPTRPVPANPSHATISLSTYSGALAYPQTVRARHEVDRLHWPAECGALSQDTSIDWNWFVDHLAMHMGLGQKCIALTSLERGAGRTTVCLTLARKLAARGLRPLVVDADCQHPDLARACHLELYSGWGEVMLGDVPLEESLVASIDDGVTLMPWRGTETRLSQLATSPRVATSFGLLTSHYDLVLIDAPPVPSDEAIAELAGFAEAIALDAVYVLHDARYAVKPALGSMCEKLRQAGLSVEGLIENFVAAEDDSMAAGSEAVAPLATHH